MEHLEQYLDRAGRAMLAVCLTYDHARSAEKMADWQCVGEDNEAWRKGPYLSSGAGNQQIDRTHPYCFRASDEFRVVAGLVLEEEPEKNEHGGVRMPLPPLDKNSSRVEPIIAKLAIIEQFEVFKEFMISIGGPYNKNRRKAWKGCVEERVLELIGELTDRRNELTHDLSQGLPSIRESVAYFYHLRNLAARICIAVEVQDNPDEPRK